MLKNNKRGFSLLEMLIVVAIIVILLAMFKDNIAKVINVFNSVIRLSYVVCNNGFSTKTC